MVIHDAGFPVGGFGVHVAQDATIDPSLGYAQVTPGYAVPRGYTVQGGALGLISPTDAWRTGHTYGLPGTTAVQLQLGPDGNYYATQLGIVSDEMQRSVGYGGRYARGLGDSVRALVARPGALAMLGAIAGVTLVGLIGVIATAGR